MTTSEKLEKCRELDDKRAHKVYVCGNAETIFDGFGDDRSHAWQDENEYVLEFMVAVIEAHKKSLVSCSQL
jgi:hypothetical protein